MNLRDITGMTKEELENYLFMKDKKTPRCPYCKKAMKQVPYWVCGEFKRKWNCDCKDFPKNKALCVG